MRDRDDLKLKLRVRKCLLVCVRGWMVVYMYRYTCTEINDSRHPR